MQKGVKLFTCVLVIKSYILENISTNSDKKL
jgi:hypothetical protein